MGRAGDVSKRAAPPAGRRVANPDRRARGGDRCSGVVRRTLAAYAERGIFRAFGDQPSRDGRHQFSFRWHTDVPLNVVYDPARQELVFSEILPGVAARSAMYRDLEAFVRASSSAGVPAHRRIDRRRASARLAHRGRSVSVVVSLKEAHLEYGVRRAVNLIHELFVSVLRQPAYFEYMVDHFAANPDM